MKKLLLIATCLITVAILNAQTLEQIVKNYTTANKLDKISGFKTIKLTAKMSMMGMEMPIEIWMKSPDKIKSVTTMNGQQIVQVFDGEKGYMVNPATGTVELTADQIKQIQRSNIFQNFLDNSLKSGLLTLDGEESVNGKPAFRVKATVEGGTVLNLFIDKSSYLLLKSSANVSQGGMAMTIESFPSEYTETNGVLLPMKTTSSMNGMAMVTTYTKVEVDIPMEDSVFKVK